MLAIEEARRLRGAGVERARDALQPAARLHIAGQLSGTERIEALHFHGLCTRWAKEAGLDSERRPEESDENYYDVRAPNLLTEAPDALGAMSMQ